MHLDDQQETQDIDHKMALAAAHTFAPVIITNSALFGSLGRLAVDDPHTGFAMPARRFPHLAS